MAHGGGVPEFDLSDDILSVIPTDPYDQLDLARKITSMAIASRVSNLEAEAERLREENRDKDRIVAELEEKASRLDKACQEAESRFKMSREDNMKLLKEKDSLALTVKKLGRDLAKLETFKRQLMQSLNDENSPTTETVDIGTYDQSMPKAYSTNDEESNGYPKYNSASTVDDVSKQSGERLSLMTYTSRLTPTGTPRLNSASISPRYSATGSPRKPSGSASPTTLYEGRGSFSSLYSSSQQSSAASSPPTGRALPGRTPRIDGKEFFRQARSRLSLEQFSAFLSNVKELNAQRQSREETLRKAEDIFGTDNKDLYISFQGLLNRSMH